VMAHYTQISQSEAEEILQLYGKSSISKISPLSFGISNSNYKIDLLENDQRQSVLLKISNDKDFQQLSQEQTILQYLNRCGYTYSLEPIKLKTGEFVYHHQKHVGVVYPFVDGTLPDPNAHTCQEVGKALAKLHSLSHCQDEMDKLRPHETVGFGPGEILEFTKSDLCPNDYKNAVQTFFPDKFEEFFANEFSKGLIHGDLYYDNTLFDNEDLKVVLDFEQSGIGEYILDLGISISGTCLEHKEISLPLMRSYLQGYEFFRPLPTKEKEFLPRAVLLGLLSIALWRIRRFNEKAISPTLQNSYRELLKRASFFQQQIEGSTE
jgi:homoserine kinase type II